MKKLGIALVALIGCGSMIINGKPGCLAKSYHLKQKFDPKEYHLVECNCPCDYWAMKGLSTDKKSKCLQCGHAHNPGPNPYVPKTYAAVASKSGEKNTHYGYGLLKLIRAYKTRK